MNTLRPKKLALLAPRGFTLLEVLLVLAVVVAATVLILSAGNKKMQASKVDEAVLSLGQISKSIYALSGSLTNYAILATSPQNALPESALDSAGNLKGSPWGPIAIRTNAGANPHESYTVSYSDVPPGGCVGLVAKTYPEYQKVEINGTAVWPMAGATFDPATAASACSGSANLIEFTSGKLQGTPAGRTALSYVGTAPVITVCPAGMVVSPINTCVTPAVVSVIVPCVAPSYLANTASGVICATPGTLGTPPTTPTTPTPTTPMLSTWCNGTDLLRVTTAPCAPPFENASVTMTEMARCNGNVLGPISISFTDFRWLTTLDANMGTNGKAQCTCKLGVANYESKTGSCPDGTTYGYTLSYQCDSYGTARPYSDESDMRSAACAVKTCVTTKPNDTSTPTSLPGCSLDTIYSCDQTTGNWAGVGYMVGVCPNGNSTQPLVATTCSGAINLGQEFPCPTDPTKVYSTTTTADCQNGIQVNVQTVDSGCYTKP